MKDLGIPIRDKKGFALIFTVFVVIGIAMMLANDYLKGIRQERQIARAVQRIQAKGVEQFVLDRGVRLLKDYVQATGSFPNGTGNTEISAAVDAPGISAGETFIDALKGIYNDWKNTLGSKGGNWLPQMGINEVEAGKKFFVCSNEISSTSREYLLTFAIVHSGTGAQQRIAQKILVSIGGLYDYSVFYNGDLEIQAAEDMTIYGPIFANGDVYLTTAAEKKLSLVAAGESWSEPYALQSSGNIYFGPKRAIARNYFLDGAGCSPGSEGFCFNPKYAKALAPTTYRAGLPELQTNDPNYYRSNTGNPVEVNPDYWYQGNQVAFKQWVDRVVSGTGTAPETKDPLLPYFYYFMNELNYNDSTSHAIWVTDSGGSPLVKLAAPMRDYFSSWTKDNTFLDSTRHLNLSRTYYTRLSIYDQEMSISSAFDPDNPPQLVGETGSDRKPDTNPRWAGVAPGGKNIVWDNASTTGAGTVARKDPLAGVPSTGNGGHLIIEPIVDRDPYSTYKLQSKTNIRVLCADEGCSYGAGYKYQLYTSDAAGNFTLSSEQSGLPNGMVQGGRLDYRLGRSIGDIALDVATVTANYASLSDDGKKLAIYIQTADGPYDTSTNYTAVVFVYNASRLPENGWTLVTNGRVWVAGDFNRYSYEYNDVCSADQWNYEVWDETCEGALCPLPPVKATCNTPHAAIFCDSFGILSNNWTSQEISYDLGTPLSSRRVTNDVYLNAAIITGSVPSQLVKAYPNCRGKNKFGNVDFTGCTYEESSYAQTNVKQPRRVVTAAGAAGNFWKPVKSYADGPPGNDFYCPDGLLPGGLQAGQPATPTDCEYWLDNDTGVYYYNNRALGTSGKTFAPVITFPATYGVNNPVWDIPLFGAAQSPYTKVTGRPYEATINFRANNMNALKDFPITPIPASSVFPGMTSAWTLSQAYLYYLREYKTGGTASVTVDSASPETVPLTLFPDSGASDVWQTFMGPAYLGDFGYMPLWKPMYSGGFENLINLQEDWANGPAGDPEFHHRSKSAIRFRGSLLSFWDAANLSTISGGTTTPAFYRNTYYSAPIRDYRFDASLRNNPPPSSPSTITVTKGDRVY